MIPPVLNDTGDCCCQCPPSGPDGWCHCNDDYNGKGDDIENAITCDLVWTERQPNGRKKYFKVVSGSSQQNMPVVLPTASLTKRGVVQLTNDLSDREDLALTPKGAKGFKEQLDRETADRVAKDTDLQNQINKEKADRANADADLLSKINQEKADRANADNALSNRITSVESKADSALTKANKAVTSVTSNGNATVTVTKADGTSNSFTINNVAHASSADSASHADVADKVKNLDVNQLGKVSFLSSRTADGDWTLSNVVINKPIFITHSDGTCILTVKSGSDDLRSPHYLGTDVAPASLGAGVCAIVVPTQNTVVLNVGTISDNLGATLRAYQ